MSDLILDGAPVGFVGSKALNRCGEGPLLGLSVVLALLRVSFNLGTKPVR